MLFESSEQWWPERRQKLLPHSQPCHWSEFQDVGGMAIIAVQSESLCSLPENCQWKSKQVV